MGIKLASYIMNTAQSNVLLRYRQHIGTQLYGIPSRALARCCTLNDLVYPSIHLEFYETTCLEVRSARLTQLTGRRTTLLYGSQAQFRSKE